MVPKRSALLVASNEICHNPRLIKMADCLLARGFDVSVFSPVVGLAEPDLYESCIGSRAWNVRSFDISKRTWSSWLTWAAASAVSRTALAAWKLVGLRTGFHLAFNRSLAGFPWGRRRFDLVVVNLVDNLPLAARLRRRHGSVLVYDSQEFFSGEASTRTDTTRSRWVAEAERRFIRDADVVTTTTQVLADRLTSVFDLPRPALRIRNAPLSATTRTRAGESGARGAARPIDLVWHGFAVHLTGRGVDVLLDAVSRCRHPVRLTLQGRLSDAERLRISAECARLQIAGLVRFAPPAHPEAIPASLVEYDVGVIAEPGLDENQRLTSSNKLFECIHAGLAVIAPDLPGIAETVSTDEFGLLYRAGDGADLARAIDRIASNADELRNLRRRAAEAAAGITWSRDFVPVWAAVEAALSRAKRGEPVPDLHEVRL